MFEGALHLITGNMSSKGLDVFPRELRFVRQ